VLIKYDLDANGNGHVFNRKKLLIKKMSEVQKIEISEVDLLGKVLVLDNIIQLSELDCDRYHETFSHIPMSMLSKPKRVLILGGGDGILAKELLKYENLVIDLVDIDGEVVELSRDYLSCMNHNSLQHERVNVYIEDALFFCQSSKQKYDAIFADITDPHPNSPSESLLSNDALNAYNSLLSEQGVFALQTDNPQFAPGYSDKMIIEIGNFFSNVSSFSISALTFSSLFTFVIGSKINVLKAKKIQVKTNWLNKKRFDWCMNLKNMVLS